ncbi:unnamed protein product [Sphagnum tenellum]
MVTLAKMYFGIPHDILSEIEPTEIHDKMKASLGYRYMEAAAKAGDRDSMVFIARALDSGLNLDDPTKRLRQGRPRVVREDLRGERRGGRLLHGVGGGRRAVRADGAAGRDLAGRRRRRAEGRESGGRAVQRGGGVGDGVHEGEAGQQSGPRSEEGYLPLVTVVTPTSISKTPALSGTADHLPLIPDDPEHLADLTAASSGTPFVATALVSSVDFQISQFRSARAAAASYDARRRQPPVPSTLVARRSAGAGAREKPVKLRHSSPVARQELA